MNVIKQQAIPQIDVNGWNSISLPLLRPMAIVILLLMAAVGLTGCGGGATTEAKPGGGTGAIAVTYTGIPNSDLVLRFAQEVWPNLNNHCATCHGDGSSPTDPRFAQTDINAAFNAAITVASLSSPADSTLVYMVGEGNHNCWLPNNTQCADLMTRWIANWAGGYAAGGREVVLREPAVPDMPPSSTRQLPAGPYDSIPSFFDTVYPVLIDHCAECHVPNPSDPIGNNVSPQFFFAHSDVTEAYNNSKPYMNLDNPPNSGLVQKIIPGTHYCRDPNTTGINTCPEIATALETAITNFAGGITVNPPNLGGTVSGAITILDATVASGGNRFENNQIALWEFKAGTGNTVYDVSAVSPEINLNLNGSYGWIGGYGVDFTGGRAASLVGDSAKLNNMINPVAGGSGEYSIEAWVIPANVTQVNSYIMSYGGGETDMNFTLGQTMYNYNYLHNSTTMLNNEAISTPDADELLQATLQHVVTTFDPIDGRRIYVNGSLTNALDPAAAGSVQTWQNDTFPFVLGSDASGGHAWEGKIRLAAIHNRALTHEQIVQNFEVGVGAKYFQLFGIGHLPGVPAGSYIMFEFMQFDSYSYLFYKPTYINLDDPNVRPGISLQGMRIGINGKIPFEGQAYSKLNLTIDAHDQVLSNMGTIIALEKGSASAVRSENDEFFLVFEHLAGTDNPFVDLPPIQPVAASPGQVSDIGLRTFDEINITMSNLTGIPHTTCAIGGTAGQPEGGTGPNCTADGTFTTYRQQFPNVENIDTFLPSHQMAISQLAMAYCNELINNTGARSTYFPGFAFSAGPGTAFDATGRSQIIDPLLEKMLNVDFANNKFLTSQPTEAEVRTELNNLIDKLATTCTTGCNTPARTASVVTATCAVALGNAATLIQ